MIHSTYHIQTAGSLPDTKLVTYIQDHSDAIGIQKRPLILVCPGGGYHFTSEREGEALALQFMAMGYHAAVLYYSCAPATYPTALLEVASSIALIRGNAEEWHVDPDKIVVEGCSAGGHLAAGYGMFWKEDIVAQGIGVQETDREILRPNAMILCYPVITSGEFAHKDSFKNLLGDRLEELEEKMSLENQVNEDTPRAFVWHTYEDQAVPVENSLMLVSALRRAGIPSEFHMYPKGGHGLSLANRLTATPEGAAIQEECESWIGLVRTWLEHLWD